MVIVSLTPLWSVGSHPATASVTGTRAGGVCFATGHIELQCNDRQIGKSLCP